MSLFLNGSDKDKPNLAANKPQASGLENRIRSLDGLRAISIFMVLTSHAFLAVYGVESSVVGKYLSTINSLGYFGVRVFFIISGFLITSILLKEIEANRRISLLRFYFRRSMRVFPPFYVFIFTIVIFNSLGLIQISWPLVISAATYTMNYFGVLFDSSHIGGWYVGHTWSLSVEEQFYLVWPAVLMLAGTRGSLFVATTLIIICPFFRWYYPKFGIDHSTSIHAFEAVADSLAVGCVLAILRKRLHSERWFGHILSSRFFLIVPVFSAYSLVGMFHPSIFPVRYFSPFEGTVANFCIVLILEWCLRNPSGKIGCLLNSRPFVFVGLISYSLYLWQQLFFHINSQTASFLPVSFLLTFTAAIASYRLIERPSQTLRDRLERYFFVTPQPPEQLALRTSR